MSSSKGRKFKPVSTEVNHRGTSLLLETWVLTRFLNLSSPSTIALYMNRPNRLPLFLPSNIAEEPQLQQHVEMDPLSSHLKIDHISSRFSTAVVVKRWLKVALSSVVVPSKARWFSRTSSQDIVMLFPLLSRSYAAFGPRDRQIPHPVMRIAGPDRRDVVDLGKSFRRQSRKGIGGLIKTRASGISTVEGSVIASRLNSLLSLSRAAWR